MLSTVDQVPFTNTIHSTMSFVGAKEPPAFRNYYMRAGEDAVQFYHIDDRGEEAASGFWSHANASAEHLKNIGEPPDGNISIRHPLVMKEMGLLAE